MKYVIGTGWWSAGTQSDRRARLFGDEFIRGEKFHKLWYRALCKYTNPEKIVIVDSASPVRSPLNQLDGRLEFIRLSLNAGHSTNHIGKYCGYVRAVLLGLEYAILCDADYFVYIEQDALIFGEEIVEHCIKKMTKPFMYGDGMGTGALIQQSFFIIKRSHIESFLEKFKSVPYKDGELCPEDKFHVASSSGNALLHSYIVKNANNAPITKWLNWQSFKYLRNWQHLPFGFGRTRPIDFSEPHFYFQHGTREEIDQYLELTKFSWPE